MLLCGHPAKPTFSPTGQAIAFLDTTSGRSVVVGADGSCLWCLLGTPLTHMTGGAPAFMPGGRGITVGGHGLWSATLTGGGARRLFEGPVDDAVWSSRGTVALMRGDWIWVGQPGHGKLRRLTRGGAPSFSPDGAMVALARGGYVWIARVAGGAERRLVRGGAPAWSPSGRRIAYIAPGGAVEIAAVDGGRARRVGSLRATTLDWQPLPASARQMCNPPPGSTVLEATRDAVVYSKRHVFYGCLKALGHPRVLLNASGCYCGPLTAVRLAGRIAAFQAEYGKPPTVSESDTQEDLSSGRSTGLVTVPGGTSAYQLDSLALDSSGFAAWREAVRAPLGIAAVSCPSESLCVAVDQGDDILSSTDPTGGPGAWTGGPVSSSPYQSFAGVSCPTTSLCVAGDSAGKTYYPVSLDAIFCASVSLCVTGDDAGNILTSTNPTGGASAWTRAPFESFANTLDTISCPSVSLCVGADDSGSLITSTDPAGGASTWTHATLSDQLYVRDDRGTRAADTAPPGQGDSIGNVLLRGDSLILSWTHDNIQRQLALH